MAFYGEGSWKLVTTAWVLTEVGDALVAPGHRECFTQMLDMLARDPNAVVLPATHELFLAGVDLFRSRPDKWWSLTDCISFVVMMRRAITDALTGDHHFEQAGFRALLK